LCVCKPSTLSLTLLASVTVPFLVLPAARMQIEQAIAALQEKLAELQKQAAEIKVKYDLR